MTYYPDLTYCPYFGADCPTLRAVGWLEPPFEFRTGGVPEDVLARLKSLVADHWEPVTLLGGQFCGFCEGEVAYSSSNLFVPGADVVYVAPESIVHHIEVHQYLPPEEFLVAVKECPPCDAMAYYEGLVAAGFPLDPETSYRSYHFARRLAAELAQRAHGM